MIKIKGLSYEYPDSTLALDNVDLHINKGEFVGLIGKNGAGKSTLLLQLNGLHLPSSGTIHIDGLIMDKSNIKKIRQKVGVVFQSPDDMLFSPTVEEDVSFGPRNLGLDEAEIKKRVDDTLDIVGMSEYKDKNPHHLSLGQKKRVAIACVLSMDPDIIVFDEPTSHLDPKGKKDITNLILSLDKTKIVATHDMNMLKHFDMVHIIEDGKIVYSSEDVDKKTLERYELI